MILGLFTNKVANALSAGQKCGIICLRLDKDKGVIYLMLTVVWTPRRVGLLGYDLCDRLGSLAIRYDNFYKRTYGGSNLSLGR